MQKIAAIFLQTVLLLIAGAALVLMIRLPLTEGRAAQLDWLHIYSDPFILYGYFSSIPFYVALYQAFRFIGIIRQQQVPSAISIRPLRIIRFCCMVCGVLISLAGLYIRLFHHKDDDPAGFLALCMGSLFICMIVAAFTVLLEKILKDDMKPDQQVQ